MDPDELLRRLREYAGEVLNAHQDLINDGGDPTSNDYALAEAALELDGWLAGGGFLPDEWSRARSAAPSVESD